jgi:hypothetical protein
MATEKQLAFFKSLYDEELSRHTGLQERAKVYLTVITIYVGVVGLKIQDVATLAKDYSVPYWLLLLVGAVVGLALLITVTAICIRVFEAAADPRKVSDEFSPNVPTDAEFFDRRIADYTVATETNRKVNNSIGKRLYWAAISLAIAVGIHLISMLLALLHALGIRG